MDRSNLWIHWMKRFKINPLLPSTDQIYEYQTECLYAINDNEYKLSAKFKLMVIKQWILNNGYSVLNTQIALKRFSCFCLNVVTIVLICIIIELTCIGL